MVGSGLNFQIAIETTTRCGGQCEGCALTSEERHDPKGLDLEQLRAQIILAKEKVKEKLSGKFLIDSISMFFGQGDHFLLTEGELVSMAKEFGNMWPEEWKQKTVLFLTASAVTNPDALRKRAIRFREECLRQKINCFVQVVFDPKKWSTTTSFKDTYMSNIMFLKKTFKMAELTVNLAGDVPDHMTAEQFHSWIKYHNFKHIEFNWVTQPELEKMWLNSSEKVWKWLSALTKLAWIDKSYDINYIPWTLRRLEQAENGADIGIDEVAFYIGADKKVRSAEVGPIGNVTALVPRSLPYDIDEARQRVEKIKWFAKNNCCVDCDFQKICADGGVYGWAKHMPKQNDDCNWGLKKWYELIKELEAKSTWKAMRYDKNPVQSELSKTDNNHKSSEYFVGKGV
jgi:hypothetical protein